MRSAMFTSEGRLPRWVLRLWIAVAVLCVTIGIVVAVHASSGAAALRDVQSDAHRPGLGGLDAASATDLARRIETTARALEGQRRSFIVILATLLGLGLGAVHLTAGLALSRHLRRMQSHLRQGRRSLARLRSDLTQLSEQALLDDRTGLPNGTGLRAVLDRWQAVDGDPICVIVVDVDAGDGRGRLSDAVLTGLSATLRDALEDTIALGRLSDTQFGVIARTAPDSLSDRIATLLNQPVQTGRGAIRPRVRIGYVRQHAHDATDLLAAARSALQTALSRPYDPVVAYCDRIRATEATTAQLIAELPSALVNGQIAAAFQPQICLRTGRLTGVEALARWQHPVHGALSPAAFFPLVHSAGLTRDLDLQVWSHALRQLTHWRAQALEIPHLALNASVETVSDPGLLRRLLAQLSGLGLDTSDIVIEVPEEVFDLAAGADAAVNVERLMAAGLRVELDGLSPNLSSIMHLPERGLSGVKLHEALSNGPQSSAGGARSVRAMMMMLDELKIPAAAKGVETGGQSRRMADAGCLRMQGNLISAPMDARSFRRWIAAGASGWDGALVPAE